MSEFFFPALMSQQLSIEDIQVIPVSFSQFIASHFIRSDLCRQIHVDNNDNFDIDLKKEEDVSFKKSDVENMNEERDVKEDAVDKFKIVRSCGCFFKRTRRPRIHLNWKINSFWFVEINICGRNKEKNRLIAICEECFENKKDLYLIPVLHFSERITSKNKKVHPIEVFQKEKSLREKYEPTLSCECYFCKSSFFRVL